MIAYRTETITIAKYTRFRESQRIIIVEDWEREAKKLQLKPANNKDIKENYRMDLKEGLGERRESLVYRIELDQKELLSNQGIK